MADFGSALWNKPASGGGGGDSTPAEDPVTRSLRWDDGNNSNLYKATGSTDTTWTVAMWVKRSKLSSLQYFFSWGGDGINFDSSDRISIWNGSAYRYTTAVFRDTSSWYHLTISCNAGTITIYVNGVAHALSSSVSYPAWGNVYFGRWSGNTSYNFDGYLADIYGIEGSALDHTSFTESNNYGGLKPKAYTGSFGTNGFHLEFEDYDDHSLIGLDSSLGNAINWDTSKYRSGYGSPSWSESNTQFDGVGGNVQHTMSNFAGSGKYYAEFEFTSGSYSGSSVSGVGPVPEDWWTGSTLNSYMYSGTDAARKGCAMIAEEKIKSPTGSDIDCSNTATDPHFTVGTDRIGIEVDGTANTAVFYRVNSSEKVEIASLNNTDDGIDFGGKVAWGCTIHDANHSIRGYFTSASWQQSPSPGFAAMPSGNHFEPTNLSSHDILPDTPTKNYATINVLHPTSAVTGPVTEGNLKIEAQTYSSGNHKTYPSTFSIPRSGKWYIEFYAYRYNGSGNISSVGVVRSQDVDWDSGTQQGGGHTTGNSTGQGFTGISPYGYYDRMDLWNDGTNVEQDSVTVNGLVCALAIDVDNGYIYGGYESSGSMHWMNSGDPTSGSSGTGGMARTFTDDDLLLIEVAQSAANNNGSGFVMNFGQDPTFANNKTSGQDTSQSEFYFAPPTGYKSLNTSNLDAPSVTPSENFEALTYTGSGSNRDITGLDFQPDLVWIKDRTTGGSNGFHCIHDSVRGDDGTHKHILSSDNTITTDTIYSGYGVTSFNSDGFSIINGGSLSNDSSRNYVAWNWKESASAGFDIVTYEGNSDSTGDTQDISHSLGVAPDMIIVKARDARAYNDYYHEDNWYVWHKDLSSDSLLFLNKSSSEMDYSSGSGYAPINTVGSSTFTVSNEEDGDSYANFLNWGDPYNYYTGDNERYVAYLFSGVEGHSKFGKYSGAGSNGVFVYTGHRPKMVWIKNMGTTGNWFMFDAVRDTYNETVNYLWANSSASETTNSGYKIDILSNGFRINVESTHMNNSAYDYVFCSWAEQPFAAPSNAR